jgi:hypothetical protein
MPVDAVYKPSDKRLQYAFINLILYTLQVTQTNSLPCKSSKQNPQYLLQPWTATNAAAVHQGELTWADFFSTLEHFAD